MTDIVDIGIAQSHLTMQMEYFGERMDNIENKLDKLINLYADSNPKINSHSHTDLNLGQESSSDSRFHDSNTNHNVLTRNSTYQRSPKNFTVGPVRRRSKFGSNTTLESCILGGFAGRNRQSMIGRETEPSSKNYYGRSPSQYASRSVSPAYSNANINEKMRLTSTLSHNQNPLRSTTHISNSEVTVQMKRDHFKNRAATIESRTTNNPSMVPQTNQVMTTSLDMSNSLNHPPAVQKNVSVPVQQESQAHTLKSMSAFSHHNQIQPCISPKKELKHVENSTVSTEETPLSNTTSDEITH